VKFHSFFHSQPGSNGFKLAPEPTDALGNKQTPMKIKSPHPAMRASRAAIIAFLRLMLPGKFTICDLRFTTPRDAARVNRRSHIVNPLVLPGALLPAKNAA
jgi:hypothetical protein